MKRTATSASWKKGHIPWNVGKKYTSKPQGYFSRKYKSCVVCGTTTKPHNANGMCKSCYYKTDEQHQAQKIHRYKVRKRALVAYGGKYPKCACCGESEETFLVIDHINGCGTERRRVERAGSPLYIYLASNYYPPGYQVLCHNCNMAKEWGICPHQKK
jgi:hypothetical protein